MFEEPEEDDSEEDGEEDGGEDGEEDGKETDGCHHYHEGSGGPGPEDTPSEVPAIEERGEMGAEGGFEPASEMEGVCGRTGQSECSFPSFFPCSLFLCFILWRGGEGGGERGAPLWRLDSAIARMGAGRGDGKDL